MTEVPQSALAHSHFQVLRRHRCCGSVVLTGDGAQTAAVKPVNHAHHRSCEGPGLTRVRERRTPGNTIESQLHRTGQVVVVAQQVVQ